MNEIKKVRPEQIAEELQRFVSNQVLRRRKEVALDVPLIESGLLDSLGVLQIVAYIDKQYGADLTQSGEPGDFKTLSSLASAVQRLTA